MAPALEARYNDNALFFEDKFHEGRVKVVTDVLVLLLLGDELVCTSPNVIVTANTQYTSLYT